MRRELHSSSRKLRLVIICLSLFCFFVGHSSGFSAPDAFDRVGDFRQRSWTAAADLGAVFDIQQSPNGFLWLTTSNGVLRFDGTTFETLDDLTQGKIHENDANSVLVSSSGRVWLTSRTSGLILIEGTRVDDIPLERRCISIALTEGMAEGIDGSLWVRGLSGLYELRGAICKQVGTEEGYPGGYPAAVFVDHSGAVWAKAPSGELLKKEAQARRFISLGYASGPTLNQAYIHQAADGSVWLSDEGGLRSIGSSGNLHLPRNPPVGGKRPPFGNFAFGKDGSLWVIRSSGLTRFGQKQWSESTNLERLIGTNFSKETGLGSTAISTIFVDREGDLWSGSSVGLDQIRRATLRKLSLPSSPEKQLTVAAGKENSVWVGGDDLPLTHIAQDLRVRSYPALQHVTCIRVDRHGTIWIAAAGAAGLWKSSGDGFIPFHFPNEDVSSVVSLVVDQADDVWINTSSGPTFRFSHGRWRQANDELGKKPGLIGEMGTDRKGSVWSLFGTSLVKSDQAGLHRYSFPAGPLDVSALTMNVRGDRIWLAGRGGVVLFRNGDFFLMKFRDPKLPGRVTGIVESELGDLWTNGYSGITHVSSLEVSRWLADSSREVMGEHYAASDGLSGFPADRFPIPTLAETGDGRLWFSTSGGLAFLDQNNLRHKLNVDNIPVYIKQVIAADHVYSPGSTITLPKGTENFEIDYTAPTFGAPERTQFHYRLVGIDRQWKGPVQRRQVFYTHIPPGRYKFELVASNENEGRSLSPTVAEIYIPPHWFQTLWFQLLESVAAVCLVSIFIRSRMKRVARREKEKITVRTLERERIARNLHDTFFQSIQGLLLLVQYGTRQLPSEEPAKKILEDALQQSDSVMREGRELLLDLRADSEECPDLQASLERIGNELAKITSSQFQLDIIGDPRKLSRATSNELCLLGREAIGNAFRHANAACIKVSLEFHPRWMRLVISDNGQGIPKNILKGGHRPGHWGLRGMKARAQNLRAKFDIQSEPSTGTTVVVTVRSIVAYRSNAVTHSQ